MKHVPVPGLTARNGRAWYQRRHKALPEGRVYKSLGAKAGSQLAVKRAMALNTLLDERGDVQLVAEWAAGKLGIEEITRAVREGNYAQLYHSTAPLLHDAIEDFLRWAEGSKREKTLRNYRSVLRKLDAAFPGMRMSELTKQAAEAWLHSNGWRGSSQNAVRNVCSKLWSWALEREAEQARVEKRQPTFSANPWRRVEVRNDAARNVRWLSPAEWAKLRQYNAGTKQLVYAACCTLAGLREDEACHLRRQDVDLQRCVLHVQRQEDWQPKTRASVREVPLVPELAEMLKRHMAELPASSEYLFAGKGGRPISPETGRRWVKRACSRAGLRGITVHELRHTFGSWLARGVPERGVPPVPVHVIARLMGNTPAVVLRYYAHLAEGDAQSAMQVIQQNVQQ